jgi:CRISPR type III-B/RAMP module RAMP protein Cmr6
MPEDWKLYNHGPNLGLLFYRRLYRQEEVISKLVYNTQAHNDTLTLDIGEEKESPFNELYKAIYGLKIHRYNQIENQASTSGFCLNTTYPGLLIGSGYTHDSNAIGDAKIGFFFDHTSGQPIIPGSSVKGALRNIFELDRDKNNNRVTGIESVKAVKYFLSEIKEPDETLSEEILCKLKDEIFGLQEGGGNDIFFDAVINIEKTGNKNILGSDYITPHKHESRKELDPYVNPNPIQFIKVLPGITFEFRFRLSVSKVIPDWTSELKCRFFKSILLTLGIGAKTNVGYGQFVDRLQVPGNDISTDKHWADKIPDENKPPVIDPPQMPENSFPAKAVPYLLKGKEFEGTVQSQIGDYFMISFKVNNTECLIRKKPNEKLILGLNMKVRVICSNDFSPDNPNISIKNK